ncbi:MAG: hypothetical protein KH285_00630 [Anaerotruncus sp.]|nr:hypothetical protein [Anaerotruncus sp.]
MSEKKPYSDRRWTDIPKCTVIGHEEITEEEKKMVSDFKKRHAKESLFNKEK